MLRCALFAVAVCAIVPNTRAAGPDLKGNWIVSNVMPAGDVALCVVKVETTGGKTTATVAFAPEGAEFAVSDFTATDKQVMFTLKQTLTIQKRQIVNDMTFVGTPGKDGKVVLGNIGPAGSPRRAKLTATANADAAAIETPARSPAADDFAKASQLAAKPFLLQNKMQQEKDAEAKKGLQKELTAARAEVTAKLPDMYREVIAKHPDTVAAAESALTLLRNPQTKLTAADATQYVELIRKQSEPYGPRFESANMSAVVESVATRRDLGTFGLELVEAKVKELTDETKASEQAKILGLYKRALTSAGKTTEAKAIDERVAKLDPKLDAEYLATVPPFKPTAYAGRKAGGANRVAVMELFTGAQCPPCVAADVAFDGLLKAYKPGELVLIQYHVHIPGPDPLTTADSEARFAYYRKAFPDEIRGAPSTVFSGKPAAGGGGGMAQGESKFKQYVGIIDPILENKTDVKVGGTATRTGDKLAISVDITGAEGDDIKLRLLVVEESVKYVGGNQVRFHHHVVRAMPGGHEGVEVKEKTFKHTASADVADVRTGLTKYLDNFATTRPFPNPARPMDMTHLKVIALLQNDKTKEIVQAAQFDVGGKSAGTP